MPVKEKIGIVVSNKMQKTVVVKVESRYPHPIYSKTMVKTRKYLAHDEMNECSVGDQVLVISVDARRGVSKSKFEITTHGGRTSTGLDMTDWITQIQKRGAGEILLNSMDADGSRAGYDIEMIKLARQHTTLPIIASGGAGSLSDFPKALAAGANALLAASVFHFGQFRISQVKAQLITDNYPVRV